MALTSGAASLIPHAAVVESQRGDAGRGKRAAQQHELPVAAGPVLRTAHHDHDTQRGGGFGDAQHTDQCVVLAAKVDGLFAIGHGLAISEGDDRDGRDDRGDRDDRDDTDDTDDTDDRAASVASTSAGTSSISAVSQKPGPSTIWL